MSKIKVADISKGDVFSEQSHYKFLGKSGDKYQFKHLESDNVINLDSQYVSDLLKTADQFDSEIEVGREDKFWTAKQIADAKITDGSVRVGDLKQKGIRSIWADIHSQQVFTVNFNKQSKELSTKALQEEKTKQLAAALSKIEKAQKNKTGVLQAASEAISLLIDNPIIPITKGEERTLRGYKTQFQSINGQYDVVDMDIETGMNKRVVNVNEINWLVFNGVRYVVK